VDGGAGWAPDRIASALLHPKTDGEWTKADALDSQWNVMIRRAIPAFVILIALSQTATAGVPLFGHVSCGVVRFYVARYSEAAAEKWARGHGAGDAEIATARRCLHGANVQTASSAAKSQVLAPVTGQERAEQEPAERDPDQDAVNVVPVQDQHADPEQDKLDNEPTAHGFIRPENIGNRSATNVSPENAESVSQESKDLAPSDRKATALRGRYVGAMHRARRAGATGHVAWFKRLWDQLTRRRQLSIAVLQFRGGRR
jgi:hypothetical protein